MQCIDLDLGRQVLLEGNRAEDASGIRSCCHVVKTNFLFLREVCACVQGNDTARAISMPTPCTHPMLMAPPCVESMQTPQTCHFHAPAKPSTPHAYTLCITERNWGCQLGAAPRHLRDSAISEPTRGVTERTCRMCMWEAYKVSKNSHHSYPRTCTRTISPSYSHSTVLHF